MKKKKDEKPKLWSITKAFAHGIYKLRLPYWAFKDDHIEIVKDPTYGCMQPWITFRSPTGAVASGVPVEDKKGAWEFDMHAEIWEEYKL